MKRILSTVGWAIGFFPLVAAGQSCNSACPPTDSLLPGYHQSAADAAIINLYREMLRRRLDGEDPGISQRHEAENREREMLRKAGKFTELWDALFQELGTRGTFNMKTARELSKSFRELEKVGAWPKVDGR